MIALMLTAALAAEPPLVQLLYPPGFEAWGGALGHAGDLDGDGFSDVAVLTPGGAEIYAVNGSGLDASPVKRLEGWEGDYEFALGSLGEVGDIDQDGFDDLAAVVDSGDTVTLAVFRGGCNGVSHVPWARIELETKEFYWLIEYGATAPAGDLDDDGYPDFVAVYPPRDGGPPIRVFRGGPLAEDVAEMQSLVFPETDQSAAPSVLVVPDLTGDAYPDLVVGAESSGTPLFVIFPGRAGGQFGERTIELSAEDAYGYQAPVDLGDLDGDGIHELLVARPHAGMLRVFDGGSGGPDEARASDLDVGEDTRCMRGVTADADDDGDLDVFALYWWVYDGEYNFGLATFAQDGGNFDPSPSHDWRNVAEDYFVLNCGLLAGPDADADGRVDLLMTTPEGIVSADPSDVDGTARLIVPAPAQAGYFGMDVLFPGDIDGDGLDDLVVGQPDVTDGHGGVDIFFRGAAGDFDPVAASYRGSASRHYLGDHLAALGDLDGDGGADFGAWGEPNTGASAGMPGAILLAAGRGPPALAVDLSGQVFEMGAAGDLDGDSYDDVVAGLCTCVRDGAHGDGCVRVYYGGAAGPTEATLVEFLPDPLPAPLSFCSTTGPGGDVDGDGLADFVVGSYHAEEGAGRLFFYPGSGDRQFSDSPLQVRGEADEGLGSAVGVLGDVDGDGYADVWARGGYEIRGYPGASYGILGEPAWTFPAESGVWVTLAPAGDFDADGAGDFVLRQATYDGIAASLVPGGPGGPDLAAAIPLFDTEGTVPHASSLAVGEVHADGSAEVAVGQAGGGSGHVWLFSDRLVPADEPCPDTGGDTGGDTANDTSDSGGNDSAGDSSDTGDSAPPTGGDANEPDCGCSASAGTAWGLSLVAMVTSVMSQFAAKTPRRFCAR